MLELELSRAPRGGCGSLDSNAYARCRAYCEAGLNTVDGGVAVDVLKYNGASCRTVSGWKHSSTKALLAGIVALKLRQHTSKILFTPVDR